MVTRFANIEEKGVIAVATLLDPRFKKIPFTSESLVEKMAWQIISDAAALASTGGNDADLPTSTQCPQTDSSSTSAVWQFFDSQVTASSTTGRRPAILALTELEQYFKLLYYRPRNEDPLLWWKQNASIFPLIKTVAKVYLSVVATSVPSERLFSKAGELISTRRNRLKPKNINMMLFLNMAD